MQLFRIVPLAVFLALTGCDSTNTAASTAASTLFERETIDPSGPNAPWGKTIGDINGDGLLDVVVGGHRPRHLTFFEKVARKLGVADFSDRLGELVWYENPTWRRHTITESLAIRTDIEVSDIDGDGANDIVLVSDSGIVWLKNGDWSRHLIGEGKFHDVELADLDHDGATEVIVRNQSLFGYKNGNFIRIFSQAASAQWSYEDLSVPHGEGLALADLDKDGFRDIVASDVWLSNPGDSRNSWEKIQYTGSGKGGWHWHDVYIDTGDFNGDGWPDILLSPSEPVGAFYEIAWLENPGGETGQYWEKHVVVENVETVHHFVAARDVDLDGDIDVLTAEMNQGEGENPVSVYLNEPGGWVQKILSLGGGHSLRAADIDNDFDVDLIGTNWQIENFQGDYSVWLWRNQLNLQQGWVRHVIDDNRPGQATAVFAEDFDGDGRKDLVSGGSWYRNPGALGDQWERSELGSGATDAALVHDFDRDGRPDVLATGWRAYGYQTPFWEKLANWVAGSRAKEGNHGERLVWARNLGAGEFEILENIQTASGDLLQGSAVFPVEDNNEERVLLSWHAAGEGLQSITVPKEARDKEWEWSEFSSLSLDEALTVADLDADQNPDVILGTVILYGRGAGDRETVWIDEEGLKPDRNVVSDLNGDGLPDIVVGFEAVSETGDLVWYQQLSEEGSWTKHLIARLTGPMSLGVADMDDDGDQDVIVGEHDLRNPERARILWFENRNNGESWLPRLIHQGDEHHDGALVVDLDADGDQDVVSIGWGHQNVIVYESSADTSE
ncbi:MAG: hypothetical protein CMM07_11025 [Rhodopirellula sp.]|nr:hypothetical protein [Rhodopirellula sp.]